MEDLVSRMETSRHWEHGVCVATGAMGARDNFTLQPGRVFTLRATRYPNSCHPAQSIADRGLSGPFEDNISRNKNARGPCP